jgi:hypothetical protein
MNPRPDKSFPDVVALVEVGVTLVEVGVTLVEVQAAPADAVNDTTKKTASMILSVCFILLKTCFTISYPS